MFHLPTQNSQDKSLLTSSTYVTTREGILIREINIRYYISVKKELTVYFKKQIQLDGNTTTLVSSSEPIWTECMEMHYSNITQSMTNIEGKIQERTKRQ